MTGSAIFDLDGTLIESLTCIADSMNTLLNQLGLPTHSRDTYKKFIGDGVEKLVERSLPVSFRKRMDTYIRDYIEIYTESWPGTTLPFNGISSMLQTLQENGLDLFVLSNKRDDLTRIQVKKIFPDIRFRSVMGAGMEFPKKPDPAAALAMLAKKRTEPGTVVFIGDSGIDMQTAVNAGMTPGGVLWGFRDREELIRNGAAVLFERPDQICEYLL